MVPCIDGWELQWYGKVPAVEKVTLLLPPCAMEPVSQVLPSLVAV